MIKKQELEAQAAILNRMLGKTDEKYFIGYENGGVHLFREDGPSGRMTISYGNTRSELYKQLVTTIRILEKEKK